MADPRPHVDVDGMALSLGDGTGVVVVYVTPASYGRSIFAWPCRDKGKRHDLNATVSKRTIDGHVVYAAIFTGVPRGDYHLMSPWGGQACRVTVESAAVTEVDWRVPSPAADAVRPEPPSGAWAPALTHRKIGRNEQRS
ncbi:MAG: hypothetical protein H0V24_07325 [Chloroflexia bacterium]|nr:hypothetical protein [Chloroflexia bacterium]MDQ3412384.1 hypothetical protein [Chloroflexota bacterium]